jgi:hypothetical protein
MPLITIAATNVSNWQRDADVQLRVYAESSFEASDGTLIPGNPPSEDQSVSNNWFVSAACTLSGTVLSIASLQLYSTTDSQDNPSACWCAYFFTSEGEMIGPFAELHRFVLPSSPTSTTWAAIAVAQRGIL